MGKLNERVTDMLDNGFRHLVAALGGRMEFAARFERPLAALADDYLEESRSAERKTAERRDFERAWKTY